MSADAEKDVARAEQSVHNAASAIDVLGQYLLMEWERFVSFHPFCSRDVFFLQRGGVRDFGRYLRQVCYHVSQSDFSWL